MTRLQLAMAILMLALPIAAGCGGDGEGGEKPELVVFAATSLSPAFEELGLAPGVAATAAVKATSVMVERG